MLGTFRSLVVLALLSMSAVLASGEAWAATITWTGTAGDGLWHTAGNWDLARIPAPGDDVVIPDLPGTALVMHGANITDSVNSLACAEPFMMPTGRLTLAAASSFSSGLVLSDATIDGAGNVTITGPGFDWRTGGFEGTGTLTISPGITWTMSGINLSSFPGLQRPLDNFGTLQITNNRGMSVGGNGVFRNRSGGAVQWLNDGLIQCNGGFENQAGATFTRSAGAGLALVQSGTFTNAGAVNIQSGTLEFNFTTTSHSGSVACSPGAVLSFGGTNATFSAGSSLIVNGTLAFSSFSNVTLDPAMAALTLNAVSMPAGGSLSVGPNVSIGSLTLLNGTLTGAGNVTVTSAFAWGDGTISGGGTITIPAGLNWTSTGGSRLERPLVHLGNGVVAGSLRVNSPGVFQNQAGATLDLRSNSFIDGNGSLVNDAGATVLRTTGTGDLSYQLNMTNAGLFSVQSGSLLINNSVLTQNGTLTTSPGASLRVNGPLNAGAGSTSTFGGPFSLESFNATFPASVAALSFAGPVSLSQGTLSIGPNLAIASLTQLINGQLTGAGNITLTNTFVWSGGTMSGTGTTTVAPGVAWTIPVDPANSSPILARMLQNDGSCVFTNSNAMRIDAGAVFRNRSSGVVDVRSANAGFNNSGTFENQAGATFLRSTGAGTFAVQTSFSNAGVVRALTGTLDLNGPLSNLSGSTLTGGNWEVTATLRLNAAGLVTNAAAIVMDGAAAAIRSVNTNADLLGSFTSNAAAGSFTIKNGAARSVNLAFSNAGAVVIGPGASTFTANAGYTQGGGSTTLAGGTLASSAGVQLNGGVLAGTGTVQGPLSNAATVSPGASPGAIAVTGNYTQTAAGTLAVELAGTTSGSGYDVLAVSGAAQLNGALQASVLAPFVPALGDSFSILTAASRTGAFASDNLPIALGPNACLDVAMRPDAVRLVALAGTAILSSPASRTACEGDSVTFAVTVSGSSANFQWRHNGVVVPGATFATLTLNPVAAADSGAWDVLVSGACNGGVSGTATLVVNPLPVFTLQTSPLDPVACAGDTIVFVAHASSVLPVTLHWRRNNVDIPGATGDTLRLTGVIATDLGTYDAVATSACTPVVSQPSFLDVFTPFVITAQPQSETICPGGSATFEVTTSGSASSFQWRHATVPIPGATTRKLKLSSVTAADLGAYDVAISGTCNSVTSSVAMLAFDKCPDTLYVDAAASPGGNGLAWGSAFQRLEDAIAVAGTGGYYEIWVARGRYLTPSGGWLLRVKNELHGGLAPGATQRTTRDLVVNETVLTGDVLNNDGPNFTNMTDNRGPIFSVGSVRHDSTMVLDGFTLRGGMRNSGLGGAIELTNAGGGRLANCRFEDNSAHFGGAVTNSSSEVVFENCAFVHNRAVFRGGAVFGGGQMTNCLFERNLAGTATYGQGGALWAGAPGARCTDCVFRGNSVHAPASAADLPQGGALFVSTSVTGAQFVRCDFDSNGVSATAPVPGRGGGGAVAVTNTNLGLVSFDDCSFFGNSVSGGDSLRGGAMLLLPAARVAVTNCRFIANTADSAAAVNGGALSNESSEPVDVVQCLFEGNSATRAGGAIYRSLRFLVNPAFNIRSTTIANNTCGHSSGAGLMLEAATGQLTMVNSILYGNTATLSPLSVEKQQLAVSSSPAPAVSFCSIQGLTGGFGGAGNVDGAPAFVSPAGPDLIAGTLDDDFRLQKTSQCVDRGDNTAVLVTQVNDLGGSPRLVDDPCKADAGVGAAPIVDLGAYEFQGTSCVVTAVGDDGAPGAFFVRSPYPNPSRGSTSLSFELSRAGRVQVDVFDLAGRRVALLADRELAAGSHVLVLDEAGVEGRRLGAGFYTLRIRAAGQSVTKPLVIVR